MPQWCMPGVKTGIKQFLFNHRVQELKHLPPVILVEPILYFGRRLIPSSGGTFESVTDEEAFRAMHLLASMEGLSVEPAAAVAFAGLVKLVRAGIVKNQRNCGH